MMVDYYDQQAIIEEMSTPILGGRINTEEDKSHDSKSELSLISKSP